LKFSKIDCWIALGEAKYYLRDYNGAIDAFGRALAHGGDSPKISAVCNLHLAEAYLANGNSYEAQRRIKLADPNGPGSENAYIRGLSKSLAEPIRGALASAEVGIPTY
jgi:tetratricopeptide (TPR) repeat protein